MCFDIGVVHCGPSEAMIVSGVGYGDTPCIICGGRAIVIPCLHKVQRISLRIMTLTVSSPRVYIRDATGSSIKDWALLHANWTKSTLCYQFAATC